MLNELYNASNLLNQALEQYSAACSTISSHYTPGSVHKGFSAIVTSELQRITSYEAAIKQARRALAKLKNACPDLAPVNSLPPELLARIFDIASKQEPCFLRIPSALSTYPSRPPESLPYVCSYWRSVALDAHTLWNHIDLAPHHKLFARFIRAGRLFAARAGHLPLNIHVNMSGSTASLSNKPGLLELCASIAERATSIKLRPFHESGAAAITIMSQLLANIVPGRLNRFVIKESDVGRTPAFIVAHDSQHLPHANAQIWHLDIPHDRLEESLLRITVLRLSRVYPYWTSQAYHGLAKLHLVDSSGELIRITQLAGILRASPQLRFLHFGTGIIEDDEPDPVCLNDLEVLHLEFDNPQHDCVLRLIIPGPGPLRMSSKFHQVLEPDLTDPDGEHSNFFLRSNVIRLHVGFPDDNAPLWLDGLLELLPNLQVLSLDGFDVMLREEKDLPLDYMDTHIPKSHPFTLYLAACSIDMNTFYWVIHNFINVKIIINPVACWVNTGQDYNPFISDDSIMMDRLVKAHPGIKFVGKLDLSKEDWN